MIIKNIIKPNCYQDSVVLMTISADLKSIPGVREISLLMGTPQNKAILKERELLTKEGEKANASDILIALKLENEQVIENLLNKMDQKLFNKEQYREEGTTSTPKTLKNALEILPDANLVLISTPGRYAKYEAIKAVNEERHVMIFSDNVSIKDEIELKNIAFDKNLLLMGPDCGTAIINGIGLGFANKIKKGPVGIVGASGTGIQEVSSIIARHGGGISHAIGTGSNDIKKEVGGLTMIQGIRFLNVDSETKVIVLISKPPDKEVVDKILKEIELCNKPFVINFLGQSKKKDTPPEIYYTKTLEDTALKALSLIDIHVPAFTIPQEINVEISQTQNKGQFIRGLYSGGTLCSEALLILSELLQAEELYSNMKLTVGNKYVTSLLKNSRSPEKNSIIDLGADEFTVGVPHPMIDFTLRNEFIIKTAQDKEAAIILFDIVLGYGANDDPSGAIIPAIKQAKLINDNLVFVASICGTEEDLQDFEKQKHMLLYAGVILLPTNATAVRTAGKMISRSI